MRRGVRRLWAGAGVVDRPGHSDPGEDQPDRDALVLERWLRRRDEDEPER
jgi:hypothetical protein